MNVNWHGVFPAATTQFNTDESVNYDSTAQLIDRLINDGVHGMVVLGTVGENCSLSAEEKREVMRVAKSTVAGRVPLLAGVAETTTAEACRFAKDARTIGLDGLMVLPGMVYKSDTDETIHHFRKVAQAGQLPIMCYNNPPAYGVDITPEAFAEMANEPLFVCIKESSENPRRITDIKNLCGDRYILFCGVDDLVMESFALGATGWVSGLVNAFPKENRLLWDLLEAGDWEKARVVYRWYTPLLHLDTFPKLVQYIKLAAAEMGRGTEMTRAPRLPLAGNERAQILKIIRDADRNRPKV
jgi:4-hydroxy-tetrahydrodipicolinate synthase